MLSPTVITNKEYYKCFGLYNLSVEIEGVIYVEEWRSVDGFEGLYEISSFGRVKSLARKYNDGRVVSDFIRKSARSNGYRNITLTLNGVHYGFGIHVLVARTFLKNPDSKRTVNHEDGIKHNNHVSNLSWATDTEQIIHAYRTGLQKREDRAGKNSSLSKIVFNTHTGIFYDCVNDAAAAHKLLEPTLSRYLTGKRKNKTPMIYV